jgi:hypothetical protein
MYLLLYLGYCEIGVDVECPHYPNALSSTPVSPDSL